MVYDKYNLQKEYYSKLEELEKGIGILRKIGEGLFKSREREDFWRVPGVEYRNGIYTVDLLKSLLDSGNTKTQDEWAKYSESAMKNKEFYVGDFPLYHSLFTALYKQKDKPESEEARAFIEKSMLEKWLMTLTRIAYQPTGKDKVIHNYGTNKKYTLEENIVGPDRFIKSADSSALNKILGTGNIQEIKEVYNWICKKNTKIWRVNQKPKSISERVARFVADSDRVDLNCYWDPVDSNSALGVFLSAEGTQKNRIK